MKNWNQIWRRRLFLCWKDSSTTVCRRSHWKINLFYLVCKCIMGKKFHKFGIMNAIKLYASKLLNNHLSMTITLIVLSTWNPKTFILTGVEEHCSLHRFILLSSIRYWASTKRTKIRKRNSSVDTYLPSKCRWGLFIGF